MAKSKGEEGRVKGEKGPQRVRRDRLDFPIHSRMAGAWIAKLVYEAGLPPLGPTEEMQTLRILEGMAFDNEERVDCGEFLEVDPIMETVFCYIKVHGEFVGTGSELLEALKVAAEQGQILSRKDTRWPTNAAGLTRHLKRHKERLAELGIVHAYQRSECRRAHILCRECDATPVIRALVLKNEAEEAEEGSFEEVRRGVGEEGSFEEGRRGVGEEGRRGVDCGRLFDCGVDLGVTERT